MSWSWWHSETVAVAVALILWLVSWAVRRGDRLRMAAPILVVGVVVAHGAYDYARGYWHVSSKLVPMATLRPDGTYVDGSKADEFARQWSGANHPRDFAVWCLYAFVATQIVTAITDRLRCVREDAKWLRHIEANDSRRGEDRQSGRRALSVAERCRRWLIVKLDALVGLFEREIAIERYCRESGLRCCGRGRNSVWLHRPGGSDTVRVMWDEQLGEVKFEGDILLGFTVDREPRSLSSRLARRNCHLKHAAWSVEIDCMYGGQLSLRATLPLKDIDANAFNAVCREILDESEACKRELLTIFNGAWETDWLSLKQPAATKEADAAESVC
jgi:hypothetical protein